MKKLVESGRELRDEDPEGPNPKFPITPKMVLGAVIALIVIIFIASNREKVTVNFVFDDAHLRLWTVLLMTFALGGVTGYLMSSVRRARRYRDRDRKHDRNKDRKNDDE